MKCPNCGKEVPEGGKFCSFCGENIEKAREEKLEEGKKLIAEGKYREALEYLKPLDFPEALYYQAVALKEIGIAQDDEGKIKEALKKLEEAEKHLDLADLWYEKAIILGLLKKHREALKAIEVALSYEPENEKYRKLREIIEKAVKEEKKPKPAPEKKPATPVSAEKIIFPGEYAIMVASPPGMGKKEFLVKCAIDHLRAGDRVVFITTEKAPEEVKKIFSKYGYNIDSVEGEKFLFIDIFSYSVKKKYDKGLSIDNPANLNAITVNLDKARKSIGSPLVVVFDSLSTLFIHAREQEIIKFFGSLISRLKANGETLIVTLQEGMHEKKTVTALEHMVDTLIKVERVSEDKKLRKIRVEFGHIPEIPDEFLLNITSGEITLKPVKKPVKLPVPPIAIAAVLLFVIAGVFGIKLFLLSPSQEVTSSQKAIQQTPVQPQEESVVVKEILSIKPRKGYIKVLNIKNKKAPEKGFLVLDAQDYNISINLDRSYFTIYDKVNNQELTVYNDTVENPTDMLTGVDIGYADLDGANKIPFSTTALHDEDGLTYSIVTTNENEGYLVVDTQGWDVSPTKMDKGYDVEGEVLFVVFANEPYFFIATEFANLQKLGYLREISQRNPDEITQTFVLTGKFDSLAIRGGDPEHLNKRLWLPYYKVQTLSPVKKPFHAGSASISLMFPDHILLGSKTDGGVIFSLPQGKFRFDRSLGPYGDQVVLEFVLQGDTPEKYVAFSVDAVNREAFLYDIRESAITPGYMESMQEICQRYEIGNCTKILDYTNWTYKRYALVVTLAEDWYDPAKNEVKEYIWTEADEAVQKFYDFEDLIYTQLAFTQPLIAGLMG